MVRVGRIGVGRSSIDNLTNQEADLTTPNKALQQKVNDLLSQISVGNKVRLDIGVSRESKRILILKRIEYIKI